MFECHIVFVEKWSRADIPFSTAVRAEFRTPAIVKTGEPTSLTFAVKDFLGRSIQSLEIHEKPMHLMVVSRDLAEFDHIYRVTSTDGILRITHAFLHGGAYRLFADYTPVSGPGRIEAFDLKVQGPSRRPIPVEPTTVWNSLVGDVRLVLTQRSRCAPKRTSASP